VQMNKLEAAGLARRGATPNPGISSMPRSGTYAPPAVFCAGQHRQEFEKV